MKMTPMLRQYLELKEQAGSALLLYRMGDFYELFFEDAQKAAPVLGITLTRRRQNDSVDAPMCGVPHHAFDGYLGKLLDAGFRVAVAEQVEDPAKAKGLVRREIVRTHTPGTISDTELLEGSEHCYLAAFGSDSEASALAWIEISTGTFEGLRSSDRDTLTEHLARPADNSFFAGLQVALDILIMMQAVHPARQCAHVHPDQVNGVMTKEFSCRGIGGQYGAACIG